MKVMQQEKEVSAKGENSSEVEAVEGRCVAATKSGRHVGSDFTALPSTHFLSKITLRLE
jgi:hypothetical protein